MNPKVLKAYAKKWRVSDPEGEITRIVIEVSSAVSRGNEFGYHDRDDIAQQGVLIALEAIEDGRYDPERPLANFLGVLIRNRLTNLYRNTCFRSEAPCDCCDPYGSTDNPCKKYEGWRRRNAAKQGLMRPVDVSQVPEDSEPSLSRDGGVVDDAAARELSSRIEQGLPQALRNDYRRMLAGVSVPKARREKVRDTVWDILYGG